MTNTESIVYNIKNMVHVGVIISNVLYFPQSPNKNDKQQTSKRIKFILKWRMINNIKLEGLGTFRNRFQNKNVNLEIKIWYGKPVSPHANFWQLWFLWTKVKKEY